MKRLALTALVVVILATIVGLLVSTSIWPLVDRVETGQTPEYPEVQPHYYRTSAEQIFEAANSEVDKLEQWDATSTDPASLSIEAERRTEVLGLVDDIDVRVEPVTEEVSRVHVTSASRVGYSDFGRNARNIEGFLARLDERLADVRFDPDKLEQSRDKER